MYINLSIHIIAIWHLVELSRYLYYRGQAIGRQVCMYLFIFSLFYCSLLWQVIGHPTTTGHSSVLPLLTQLQGFLFCTCRTSGNISRFEILVSTSENHQQSVLQQLTVQSPETAQSVRIPYHVQCLRWTLPTSLSRSIHQ